MKVPPREIERVLGHPGALRAALIFGPDEGLVRERAGRLGTAVLGTADDPFSRTEFGPKDVTDDPARLADELLSPSLLGGKRLIVLSSATDTCCGPVEAALEALSAIGDPPGFLIVTAGELRTGSRLRKVFEGEKSVAAIACYPDTARDLEGLIRSVVGDAGHRIEDDAVAFLQSSLGSDRMVSRSELEKLVLYKGAPDAPITVADCMEAVGDSGALAIQDVVDAATAGDLKVLDRSLKRLEAAGESSIGVLRLLARRLQRLHLLVSARDQGTPMDKALASLTPRAFWQEADALKRAADLWTPERMATAMDIVLEAEEQSKQTGYPAEAICAQACFRIAGAARAGRRRR
jgi:DNA polymerase-3 subunit delta